MSDPYTGEIRIFAGNFAPQNWALCDGTLLTVTGHEELFSLLGNRYGGDGITNFALPDLRGRLPIHRNDNPGQTGLSTRPLGQQGGRETVQLGVANLPGHTHQLQASQEEATSKTPDVQAVTAVGKSDPLTRLYSTNDPTVDMAASAIGGTGGDQPHTNLMPFMCINFIICLNGLYPPRN